MTFISLITLIIATKNNFNNNYKAIKKVQGEWITLKEVPKFFRYTIWLLQLKCHDQDILKLGKSIVSLIKSNGFNFTFQYLKECTRLVTMYLAGTPDRTYRSGVRVRVNRYGLPVIIPSNLRAALNNVYSDKQGNKVIMAQVILTALNIFRTFPTKVKPDLSSVIEPFSGISQSILIDRKLVKSFVRGHKIDFGTIRGFISESAGPIAKRATWGSGIDAIALLLYPYSAFSVMRMLIQRKAYLYSFSLLSLWITLGPIYILTWVLGVSKKLPIGRLSVVYDQAGKARIVAMPSFWIQLCLKPLHESIFRFLKTVAEDGTFNQLGPLNKLKANPNKGHDFSCFDLSAATDRLPIDLQVDILNLLGLDGQLWRDLLDIPWSFRGKEVRYAVGQPMGAYSSWGMLALTHHLIVKVAASRVGISDFTNYAILGDDIVINHNLVALEYTKIMEVLGVKINPNKSVVSKHLIEFAKRLATPSIEFSPVGAGAILSIMRKPALIGAFLTELNQKSLANTSGMVRNLLNDVPFKSKGAIYVALWTCYGVKGLLSSARQLDAQALSYITYGRSIDPFVFQYSLHEGIRTAVLQRARSAISSAESAERYFYMSFWRLTATRGLVQGFYETLALFLAPGFWLYLESLIRQTEKAKIFERDVHSVLINHEGTLQLLEMSPIVGLDLRWSKQAGKQLNLFIRDASRAIWKTYDQMENDCGMYRQDDSHFLY